MWPVIRLTGEHPSHREAPTWAKRPPDRCLLTHSLTLHWDGPCCEKFCAPRSYCGWQRTVGCGRRRVCQLQIQRQPTLGPADDTRGGRLAGSSRGGRAGPCHPRAHWGPCVASRAAGPSERGPQPLHNPDAARTATCARAVLLTGRPARQPPRLAVSVTRRARRPLQSPARHTGGRRRSRDVPPTARSHFPSTLRGQAPERRLRWGAPFFIPPLFAVAGTRAAADGRWPAGATHWLRCHPQPVDVPRPGVSPPDVARPPRTPLPSTGLRGGGPVAGPAAPRTQERSRPPTRCPPSSG